METRNSLVIIALLTATLLLALYLRTNGLTTQGLGFDETIHIYAAKSIIQDGSPTMPSGKVYTRALPYTYAVALSFKLFGVSAFSARLPSVIFGMLSILIVFFIGSAFFDRSVGVLAALFMAFVPFEVVWSRTCRMYSMYQFLYLCTFYAFYRGFEKQSILSKQQNLDSSPPISTGFLSILRREIAWHWIVLTGLFCFSAYKVHRLVLIFGGSLFVYVVALSLIMSLSTGFHSSQTKKYVFASVFALIIGGVCMFLPGFFPMINGLHRFTPQWASNIEVSPLAHVKFLFSPHLMPLMFFFLLGVLQTFTRMSRPAFYTATCVIVPLAVHSVFVSIQRPRYIYDIFPLFLIICAYGVRNIFTFERENLLAILERKLKPSGILTKMAPVSLIVLITVLFFIPTPTLIKGLTINRQQAAFFGGQYNVDWKKGCKYIVENKKPTDALLATIPLAAEFCGCPDVNYNLDNGEIDQFTNADDTSFQRHVFADVYAITDFQGFKKVMAENVRGWIIADKQRFNNPANIPADIQKFVTTHLKRHKTSADSTMYIFSWDRSRGISE